jgi:hypothetical protein
MHLLVYEHVSGGGFAGGELPPNILSEGYGMLRSLVSDLKAAGHKITVLLDSRLSMLNPPLKADRTIAVSSFTGLDETLKTLVRRVDAAYIIAPESNHTLRRLVELVETHGGTSLNSQIKAIEKASDKMKTYETLRRKKLGIPETMMASIKENIQDIKRQAEKLGFPLVFKPVNEVGCGGLSVVKEKSHVEAAVEKIRSRSRSEHFIVQRLIDGVAASVSLLSTGEKALPVTLNKQLVFLASPSEKSEYLGGFVPFSHGLKEEALKAAQTAVEAIRGLRGYVGVDLVLTENQVFIMEVNPRLTTSYIGLRKVVHFNLAQAIIEAVLEGRLPEKVITKGCVFFSKVKVPLMLQVFKATYKLENVVSPPFPVASNGQACALIAAHTDSEEKAEATFHKAEKHLLRLFGKKPKW